MDARGTCKREIKYRKAQSWLDFDDLITKQL